MQYFINTSIASTVSLVHTSNSVGDYSPPGKCDRMNDMQKTQNCLLLKSDSILLSLLCASSLICIRQKHKISVKTEQAVLTTSDQSNFILDHLDGSIISRDPISRDHFQRSTFIFFRIHFSQHTSCSFQEFRDEDTTDLFLLERETELKKAQEEKRQIQLTVPGIINPHDLPEEMQDQLAPLPTPASTFYHHLIMPPRAHRGARACICKKPR